MKVRTPIAVCIVAFAVAAIAALEFGVVKQTDDPRYMGDGMILRSALVKAGEKVVLQPLPEGLKRGHYNVHARACWPDGTRSGRWSESHEVLVDLVQPSASGSIRNY